MIFLSAWAFGLLSLAGVIALLYFLRRHKERRIVSAIWLWQEEHERPRSALTLMWTEIWLLLIQLAALAALVVSLAQPTLTQEFLGGGTLALIIDGSASMQTVEHGQTRYERALAHALELIEQRRPNRLTIIQAQRQPKLLVPFTEDRARALAALKASQPTLQGDATPTDIIELVRSQGGLDNFDEILYLSDHEFYGALPVRWISVGEPVKNLAITGFAARPLPDGTARVAVWARVENVSSEALEGTLTLFAEEAEIRRERIALGPREHRDVEALAPLHNRFRAVLDVDDNFVFDNVRYSLIPKRPKLKIFWVGERNFFLMRALSTFAELSIHTDEAAEYDLVIANNATVRPLGRALLIKSTADPLVVHTESMSDPGPMRVLLPAHPIVQNVRAEHLRPTALSGAQLAPEVQTLIASGDQPIVATYRSGSFSFVYLGVDLKDSPLVLTPSFPIFVRNSINWLVPELGLPLERFVSEEFATPGFADQMAINLDPAESNVNRFGSPSVAAGESPETAKGQAYTPIWHLGAWAALGALFIELLWYYWGVFRRREVEL